MILGIVMVNHQPHQMSVIALSTALHIHYHKILYLESFANLQKLGFRALKLGFDPAAAWVADTTAFIHRA